VTRALLALLLTIAPVAGAAADPEALAALEDCAARLDPGGDFGYQRIAMRCPQLAATLEASPYAAWLPPDWKELHNQLSAAGLRALHDALARESAAASGSRALHPERVRAVLERVMRPEREPQGWWARIKRWLRELLTRPPQEDGGWWRHLFGDASIDRATLRVVAGLSIALLVMLAVAVVANELRIAGVLRRRPGSPEAPRAGRAVRAAPGLADLESAPPSAQPALLLELIAARLAAQNRLPPARAFTVRELTRRARLTDEAERARLAELAGVSERVRFGGGEVAQPELAAALARGRELLLALETAAAAGAA